MSDPIIQEPPTPHKKFEPRPPSVWVHSMIRAYIGQKVQARTGKTWDDFERSGFRDSDYRDAVNSVCMDAFYEIRSRKALRDFLSYWTGSICSVPQFIHPTEFARVAATLLDPEQWEDVQSLALLALSAHSQPDSKQHSNEPKSVRY